MTTVPVGTCEPDVGLTDVTVGARGGGIGELVDVLGRGRARRPSARGHRDDHLIGRGSGRIGGRVGRELAVPVHLDVGGGHSAEEHLRRRPEVVALDRHRGPGGGVGRGRRAAPAPRQARRSWLGVGSELVSMVGFMLSAGGFCSLAKISAYCPLAVLPSPIVAVWFVVGRPGPENVVPVAPAARVRLRCAVEIGPAVAVVVHPGVVGAERRVVLGEDRSGLSSRGTPTGGAGSVLAAAAVCAAVFSKGSRPRELGETAVAALLVRNDELLHRDRCRWRSCWAGRADRAPRGSGRR